jgi:cysteine-rich repeat protein
MEPHWREDMMRGMTLTAPGRMADCGISLTLTEADISAGGFVPPLPCRTGASPETCVDGDHRCGTLYENSLNPYMELYLEPVPHDYYLFTIEILFPSNPTYARLFYHSYLNEGGGAGYQIELRDSYHQIIPTACLDRTRQVVSYYSDGFDKLQHRCSDPLATSAQLLDMAKVRYVTVRLPGEHRQLWIKDVRIVFRKLFDLPPSPPPGPPTLRPPPLPHAPPDPPVAVDSSLLSCHFFANKAYAVPSEATVVLDEPCGLTPRQCCLLSYEHTDRFVNGFTINGAGCCTMLHIKDSQVHPSSAMGMSSGQSAGTGIQTYTPPPSPASPPMSPPEAPEPSSPPIRPPLILAPPMNPNSPFAPERSPLAPPSPTPRPPPQTPPLVPFPPSPPPPLPRPPPSPPARCGDGVLQRSSGEECDDGNIVAMDGCSPACTLESVYYSEINATTKRELFSAHTHTRFAKYPIGCPDGQCFCNDGSPYQYYYRPSPLGLSTTWIIHLEGGGQCYDQASCLARVKEDTWRRLDAKRTTSKQYSPTRIMSGLFSAKHSNAGSDLTSLSPDVQTEVPNANIIYAPYCSSDAWLGDNDSPWGDGMQFRGDRIVKALITEAVRLGMGSLVSLHGHTLLFGGTDTGGAGAMVHCDLIGKMIEDASVQVFGNEGGATILEPSINPALISQASFNTNPRCYFDSSMYPEVKVLDDSLSISTSEIMNSTIDMLRIPSLESKPGENYRPCVAEEWSHGRLWKCIHPYYAIDWVLTDYLLLQSLYDTRFFGEGFLNFYDPYVTVLRHGISQLTCTDPTQICRSGTDAEGNFQTGQQYLENLANILFFKLQALNLADAATDTGGRERNVLASTCAGSGLLNRHHTFVQPALMTSSNSPFNTVEQSYTNFANDGTAESIEICRFYNCAPVCTPTTTRVDQGLLQNLDCSSGPGSFAHVGNGFCFDYMFQQDFVWDIAELTTKPLHYHTSGLSYFTFDECQFACASDHQCRGFTFHAYTADAGPAESGCYLYKGFLPPVAAFNAYQGAPIPDGWKSLVSCWSKCTALHITPSALSVNNFAAYAPIPDCSMSKVGASPPRNWFTVGNGYCRGSDGTLKGARWVKITQQTIDEDENYRNQPGFQRLTTAVCAQMCTDMFASSKCLGLAFNGTVCYIYEPSESETQLPMRAAADYGSDFACHVPCSGQPS